MNFFLKLINAIVFICVFSSTSKCAEFSQFATIDKRFVFMIVGDLNESDGKKFIKMASGVSNALVVLNSRGGNLFAGIEIGKTIRIKGFSTLVSRDSLCASACALAWLAGRQRLMDIDSRIGFHSAYTIDNGKENVSSAGNALVGAYLNQLGLSSAAIIYITNPPPDAMQWLSEQDANRYGIEVKGANINLTKFEVNTDIKPNKMDSSKSKETTEVTLEMSNFVKAFNLPNVDALIYFETKYTDIVEYYGKKISKQVILANFKVFFERWRTRKFVLLQNLSKPECEVSDKCVYKAAYEYHVSGNILSETKSMKVTFVWIKDIGGWKVARESLDKP